MGMLGSAFMGAGAGLGTAMTNLGEDKLKLQHEELQRQAEREKEARIEEAVIRQEGRADTRQIATETRAIGNADIIRKNEFDFNTNPDNVKRTTDAKVQELSGLNEYNDGRFPTTLSQTKQLADAQRGPDHYNAYGTELDNQIKQTTLDKAKRGYDLPDVIELQFKSNQENIKSLRQQLLVTEEGPLSDAIKDDIESYEIENKNIANQYKPDSQGGGSSSTDQDPARRNTGTSDSGTVNYLTYYEKTSNELKKKIASEPNHGKRQKLLDTLSMITAERDDVLAKASYTPPNNSSVTVEQPPAKTTTELAPKISMKDAIKNQKDMYEKNAAARENRSKNGLIRSWLLTPEEIKKQNSVRK